MKLPTRHQWLMTALGVFLAVGLVLANIWLVNRMGDDRSATPPPAAAPATTPPGTAQPPAATPPTTVPATMTVKVYFHRGTGTDPVKVVAVRRSVPRSPKVATAALTQLLAGPTRAERKAGYWSMFSSATAGKLRSVRIADTTGYADFRDLRQVIPNASSSAGSAALLAELDTTLKQFGNVRGTVYSINGEVSTFYEWLQLSPPESTNATLAEAQRVARTFLTDVVGMRNLTSAGARWRSDFIATADFRTRVGENASARGPLTRVHLGKSSTTFKVYSVTTDTIRVDRPAAAITPSALAVVKSPVTISGAALAFEGTVNVRVVQINNGRVRQLGSGHVIGGGDVLRPFTGQIAFAEPAMDTGWLLATELSAYNGAVTKATAVRVAFTQLSS